MDELTKWLFEQLGLVIVEGIVIWWLQKKLLKVENDKDKLSNDVIKLVADMESKLSTIGGEDKEFKDRVLTLLNEIKGGIR